MGVAWRSSLCGDRLSLGMLILRRIGWPRGRDSVPPVEPEG